MTLSGIPRSVRAAAAVLLAAFLLTISLAQPAEARPDGDYNVPSAGRGVCAMNTGRTDTSALPVNRWAGGTDKFHSRLGTKAWNDVAEKLQRQGVTTLMYSLGNTAWSLTTGITETAINFCILDKAGGAVDEASAKIGKAILNSGIAAAFVVATVVVYAWRVARASGGGANTSLLFQKALIIGLFGIMIAGSTASTGGGKGGNDSAYVPGTGSPGWFVVTIDNVVSASASSLTSSLLGTQTIQGAEEGYDGENRGNDGLGCAPYVKAMKDIYTDRYSTYAGKSEYLKASAATPLLLSSMWEKTGLQMWVKAQFGDRNDYGKFMYCRLLEFNADSPRTSEEVEGWDTSVQAIMNKAGQKWVKFGDHKKIDIDVDSSNLAFRYSGSNKWRDRAWVGWGACAAPDGGTKLVHDDDPSLGQLNEKCTEFFQKTDWDGGNGSGEFDWDDSDDDISQTPTSKEAKDFLLTLHGNKNEAGLITGLVYMLSSAMIAAVFILFGVAVMVAKVAALMMMLMIFGVLLIALLPNANAGKIADYAKQYVGLSLFAWGAQLLLSIMALITAILVDVGGDVVPDGPGGIMGLMWTGFAPVIAAICLHIMFKKLRMPSPLKPSAGMAWGQMAASGAVGAGAMAGGTMLGSRLANRAKGATIRGGKKAAGSVLPGKERRSRMTPGGDNPVESARTKAMSPDSPGGEGITGKERVDILEAARQEKAEADAWAKENGVKEPSRRERIGAWMSEKKEGLSDGWAQFKDRPLQTTKAGLSHLPGAAKKTALVGGAGFAIAATGGLAGLGIAGGALAARSAARRREANKQSMLNGEATSRSVEEYRAHLARQKAEQEARQAEEEARQQGQPSPQPTSRSAPQNAPQGNGQSFNAPSKDASTAPPAPVNR